MSKPTNTIGAIVAKLFPKSQKVVSEKLSTEEFNEFAEDAQELSQRLDAQEQGNSAVERDRVAAQTQVTELTGKLETANSTISQLTSDKTALEGQVTTLQSEKTELEGKLSASNDTVTKLKASINPLVAEDASNSQLSADEGLTDTDREARQSYIKK